MARIISAPSDGQKPYAKKMQYLAKVWEGSKEDVWRVDDDNYGKPGMDG